VKGEDVKRRKVKVERWRTKGERGKGLVRWGFFCGPLCFDCNSAHYGSDRFCFGSLNSPEKGNEQLGRR
jgi:hypothetical protein